VSLSGELVNDLSDVAYDLFCLCIKFEGFRLPALEAMSLGCF